MEHSTPSRPERTGQPWSVAEEHSLMSMLEQGAPIRRIAAEFKRSERSIHLRQCTIAEVLMCKGIPIEQAANVVKISIDQVNEFITKKKSPKESKLDTELSLLREIRDLLKATKKSSTCSRCGRNTHDADNCFARNHLDGSSL
jgi:hypothetical protein